MFPSSTGCKIIVLDFEIYVELASSVQRLVYLYESCKSHLAVCDCLHCIRTDPSIQLDWTVRISSHGS